MQRGRCRDKVYRNHVPPKHNVGSTCNHGGEVFLHLPVQIKPEVVFIPFLLLELLAITLMFAFYDVIICASHFCGAKRFKKLKSVLKLWDLFLLLGRSINSCLSM